MILLSVFAIGFIAVSFIGRAIAEYIVHKDDKQAHKTLQRPAGVNKAIQRYYNTNRKGA